MPFITLPKAKVNYEIEIDRCCSFEREVSDPGEFGLIKLLAKILNSSQKIQIASYQQFLIDIADDVSSAQLTQFSNRHFK